MKAIQIHIDALKIVFDQLKQGRFIVYFIPGIFAAFIFFSSFMLISQIEGIFSFVGDIPLIGNLLLEGITQSFGFISFLLMQLYVFFVLTVLSPFNTLLSEALDSQLTGKSYTFSISQVISDFFRMLLVVTIALTLEFLILALWWIFSWMLGFGFLDKIVYILISAFFFAFSFYDYSLERYKVGTLSSLKFAWKHLSSTLLTGIVFIALYSIPFVGVILAPVLTTMLATVVYLKTMKIHIQNL
jgi:CysZ protein